MMQSGLHWIGIGSRECENEHHCKLDTNQCESAQVRKVVLMLEKLYDLKLILMGNADSKFENKNSASHVFVGC
jgi:hypothetical protein